MKHKASDSNLDFDGMGGTGYSRAGRTGVCNNMYSLGDRALSQNYGRGPTKGNASSSPMTMGAPAQAKTIATAAGGGPIVGRAEVKSPSNPSKINMGMGPRKGNQS